MKILIKMSLLTSVFVFNSFSSHSCAETFVEKFEREYEDLYNDGNIYCTPDFIAINFCVNTEDKREHIKKCLNSNENNIIKNFSFTGISKPNLDEELKSSIMEMLCLYDGCYAEWLALNHSERLARILNEFNDSDRENILSLNSGMVAFLLFMKYPINMPLLDEFNNQEFAKIFPENFVDVFFRDDPIRFNLFLNAFNAQEFIRMLSSSILKNVVNHIIQNDPMIFCSIAFSKANNSQEFMKILFLIPEDIVNNFIQKDPVSFCDIAVINASNIINFKRRLSLIPRIFVDHVMLNAPISFCKLIFLGANSQEVVKILSLDSGKIMNMMIDNMPFDAIYRYFFANFKNSEIMDILAKILPASREKYISSAVAKNRECAINRLVMEIKNSDFFKICNNRKFTNEQLMRINEMIGGNVFEIK